MPFDGRSIITPMIEALDRVIARINHPNKWVKNTLRSGSRVCIIGAVEATVHDEVDLPLMTFLHRQCLSQHGTYSIEGFNDATATKHADVMAFLARCREQLVVEAIDALKPGHRR